MEQLVLIMVLLPFFVGYLLWHLSVEGSRFSLGSKLRLPKDTGVDERCVACGDTQIHFVGQGHYECDACGYEGGSGRERRETKARAEGWQARPLGERLAAAGADVEQARWILASVEGEVRDKEREAPLSGADIALKVLTTMLGRGMSRGAGDAKRALDEARRRVSDQLLEARAALAIAADKVPGIVLPEVPPGEPEDPEFIKEHHWVLQTHVAAASALLAQLGAKRAP